MKKIYIAIVLAFVMLISVGCVAAADTKAPTVTKSDPYNGQKNVDLSKTIKVTFNENIQWGNGEIYLKGVKSGNTIPITMTKGATDLWVRPLNKMNVNAQYRLEIKSGSFTDLSGNPVEPKAIYFTTRPYKYTYHVMTHSYTSYSNYDSYTGYYYYKTKYLTLYWKKFVNGYRFGYPQNTMAVKVFTNSPAVLISKVEVYGNYYTHEVFGDNIIAKNTYYSVANKWLRPPYGYWLYKQTIYYKIRY